MFEPKNKVQQHLSLLVPDIIFNSRCKLKKSCVLRNRKLLDPGRIQQLGVYGFHNSS